MTGKFLLPPTHPFSQQVDNLRLFPEEGGVAKTLEAGTFRKNLVQSEVEVAVAVVASGLLGAQGRRAEW